MKTKVLAAALLITGCTNTYADTFLGVYAGAQAWQMESSGGFSNTNALTNFNFDDETKGNIYVAFEHFVPLIPNIKVAHTDMGTAGDVTLKSNFTFGGQLFLAQSAVNADVQLTNTDIVFYYEILDNDLVSIDIGINAKSINGELLVKNNVDNSNVARQDFSGMVPTLYSRIGIGIPATGLALYAEGSFLSIDDHKLSDYQLGITYDVVDNLAVEVDIQLGYRAYTLELEDLDNIYSNLEFKGAFAGIEVHF